MSFESQAEIYQALLDGKKIRLKSNPDSIYSLYDGHIIVDSGAWANESFFVPRDWEIYEEPKKIKRTFYTMITHGTLHDGITKFGMPSAGFLFNSVKECQDHFQIYDQQIVPIEIEVDADQNYDSFPDVKPVITTTKLTDKEIIDRKRTKDEFMSAYAEATMKGHETEFTKYYTKTGHVWTKQGEYWKDETSGLLWKDKDENGTYTFDSAVDRFGSLLPTKDEWEIAELHGLREVIGIKNYYFWSASVNANNHLNAWFFYGAIGVLYNTFRYFKYSVLCVKRSK